MAKNVDLSVEVNGLKFKNPFMLSSAPPTTTGEMIERAFEAGWAGAVVKTLALEKVTVKNVSPRLNSLSFESFGEEPKKLYGLENIELISDRPLSLWLKEISRIRSKYPDHVILASLMADAGNKEDWQELARKCEAAGCCALELNFSCPHGGMPGKQVGSDIGHDPHVTREITSWVKSAIKIPVWVKLTPNITDISVIAKAAKEGGADAISAINTVKSLSGIDLDTIEPLPSVDGKSTYGGYSGPAVKPIALRIVSEIAKAVDLPISGIGGITNWRDAAEFVFVGASTLQVCTAVMFGGYEIIRDLCDGLANYMEEKGFATLKEMRGKALPKIIGIHELNKDFRVVSEIDKTLCIKCDLCYIACRDAGCQAITLDTERLPSSDKEKCTGCSLCMQVCPVWDCIIMKNIEMGVESARK